MDCKHIAVCFLVEKDRPQGEFVEHLSDGFQFICLFILTESKQNTAMHTVKLESLKTVFYELFLNIQIRCLEQDVEWTSWKTCLNQ